MSLLATGRIHTDETKQKLSNYHKNNPSKGILVSANIRKKKISQYSIDGEFIRNWNSITEAALNLNLDRANISATIHGKFKHCGGFRWSFLGENLSPLKKRKMRDKSTYAGGRKKKL